MSTKTLYNLVPRRVQSVIDGTGTPRKLIAAFLFHETPQGSNYWWNRVDDYRKHGKPLSKTAKRHLQRLLNKAIKHEATLNNP